MSEPQYTTIMFECDHCGERFDMGLMLKSNLNGQLFCSDCVPKVIAQDEKEYPGEPGNHQTKDFELVEQEYEEIEPDYDDEDD